MRVKATLTIDVWVDDAESVNVVERQLHYAVEHLIDVGMLTGDGEAILDTCKCNVVGEEVK